MGHRFVKLPEQIGRVAVLPARGSHEPAKVNGQHPLEIVSVGLPLSGNEVRIVDELGVELGDRHEGRLEFRGPCATSGYFRNEAKTRRLIRGDWYDSGDRAYMAGGEIFITGRIKDIIIRGGRNFYPQEIEEAIAEIKGIRKGCVAVSDIAGTPPDEVILTPPRSVPKTSSGKIRRTAARELYKSGRLGEPQQAAWRQVLRLSLAAIGPRLARIMSILGQTIYAAWWWIVVSLAHCSRPCPSGARGHYSSGIRRGPLPHAEGRRRRAARHRRRCHGVFAVGTRVTPRPPHRSGRAQLRHPAPTSGVWRRSAQKAMDEGFSVSAGSPRQASSSASRRRRPSRCAAGALAARVGRPDT